MISTSLKNAIRKAVQKRLPRAIKLRQRFHQIPEPSFEERATARLIAEELRQEGIELEEGLAQTGIVATVSGTRPGNVVALRADIDGLAIEENSSKPYVSQNTGFAHSCGHDGHIVCALETSRILWELRDHLAGSVKILFQPAEETGSGAQAMIAAGALGDPLPSAIFTVHTWPELDIGIVASKPGVITSGCDIFTITVIGKGGHGSRPHETRSPILSAGRIAQSLSTLTQPEEASGTAFVVSVGIIRGGEQANTIPDEALIQGTIRTQNESVRQEVLEKVKATVRSISEQDRITTDVMVQQYCPHVHNNHSLYQLFEKTADELLGPQNRRVFMGQSMGSEDFGFYTQHIPGLLVRLGMGKACQPLHTSGFDFSDSSLESGITILTGLALMATESTFQVDQGVKE